MTRIVADASICGAWVLPDEGSPRAEKMLRSILVGDFELWVPALWTYEMTNLLLSAHRRKRIANDAVFEALTLLAKVPIKHTDVPEPQPQERTARFALRFGLSAYDAAYLELSDRLQASLHTSDSTLRKAAKTLGLTG